MSTTIGCGELAKEAVRREVEGEGTMATFCCCWTPTIADCLGGKTTQGDGEDATGCMETRYTGEETAGRVTGEVTHTVGEDSEILSRLVLDSVAISSTGKEAEPILAS